MVLKRRKFIKNLSLAVPMLAIPFQSVFAKESWFNFENKNTKVLSFEHDFSKVNDRIWIGNSFWSVPMEDWEIKNKRLEFSGIMKMARLHLLTHTLNKDEGQFAMTCEMGLLNKNENIGSAGFSVGIKDDTDPESIKAACYFGKGISMGVSLDGKLFVAEKTVQLPAGFDYQKFVLHLEVSSEVNKSEILLKVTDQSGNKAEVNYTHNGDIHGLVALENNCNEKNGSTFWYNALKLQGNKLQHVPDNSFGPILWAMYTLSRGTLKLSVQLPPIGIKDSQKIELQLSKNGKWKKEAVSTIDSASYSALFTLTNWDANQDIPYRLVYTIDGELDNYTGVFRKEPLDRALLFGGLTCQQWQGFPYRPLVENLEKSNPDMLYFSGDQIYEENGGYFIKREPEDKAILSYLGKWYMFGWAFGNVMRDRPTVCTPDDHDVFQGNLWGDGGASISFEKWKTDGDANGGFVQTPKMINVVNKTQCGHLPMVSNQEVLPSGITTWYSHLVYGRISFAIVSDRAFKSGPEKIRPGKGRIDHITERLKPNELESETLNFMGQSQLNFLEHWTTDWEGADMKIMLSQTLFANVGTHHGGQKQFLYGDMDSGGWPKSQRDAVLRVVRKACTFHINGDQHLPFMVQYGIEKARDAGWTFCTPAISTGYARWGQPDLVNNPCVDRPEHNLPNTGCYRDIFGNENYIYAVGNPDDDFNKEPNRYVKCQKKSSGYGLVTLDQKERTIKMEAIRFLADLSIDSDENRFPGWPLTISQFDNDGRRPFGYLPRLTFEKPNQVIKIVNQNTQELIQAIRVKGYNYVPEVYELASYTLVIGEGGEEKTIYDVEISSDPQAVLMV
ncbi:alkaline phosphatase D family protein [Formosa sp. 4Alg 33]|uniref:alkaline phosphatase D family protein n=1 Tax=Formosa sp. 4Alg 33 TaxID=3382189 RepID=UPI003D9C63C8